MKYKLPHHTRLFTRNDFIWNLHAEGQKIYGTCTSKTKFLKNFSISKISITATDREFGSRLLSALQWNSHDLCVTRVPSVSWRGFCWNLEHLSYPVLTLNTYTIFRTLNVQLKFRRYWGAFNTTMLSKEVQK